MNWLGKMFKKKKKSYPQDNKFKLCIIEENSEFLHETLGIIESRCQELSVIVLNAYDKNESMHDSVQEILDQCKHINEVVLALSVFHKYSEMHNKKRMLDKMLGL